MTTKHSQKKKIDNCTSSKIRTVLFVKDLMGMIRQAMDWEKIFADSTFDKALNSRYVENSQNSRIRKPTIQF